MTGKKEKIKVTDNTEEVDMDVKDKVKADEKDETDKRQTWKYMTAGSYALVMIIIGLPLWWKTTTVHREPLPYEEMSSIYDFYEEHLIFSLNIELKGFTDIKVNHLKSYDDVKKDDIHFNFKTSDLSQNEGKVFKESKGLTEIDQQHCKSPSYESKLTIFNVPRINEYENYEPNSLILGNCRNAYYISNADSTSDKIIATITKSLIELENKFASNNHFPLSSGYDVLFSLLIPEPEVLSPEWNIEHELKNFVNSLLLKLNHYAEFNFRSQVLYYIHLNIRPKLNGKGFFEVSRDQLPLVINPVETKLTSFVSQNPVLNFLVYTSPCEETPIMITPAADSDPNSTIPTNSFIVPEWGGIYFYNAPSCRRKDSDEKLANVKISMNEMASVFLTQIRSLMGFNLIENKAGIQQLKLKNTLFRDWEVDISVRNRLKALLLTSANTLKSLGNLLDQITNIVVTEEVRIEVEKSVESLKMAFELAKKGDLRGAQEGALAAYKSSEIAFHHQTNLAQLYFPDDQKYAIYIPLFLPIGIPVLFSIINIIKFIKKK